MPTKMREKPLQLLTLKVRNHRADDIALIFADPSSKDLESMIRESSLVDLIRSLLWSEEFKLTDFPSTSSITSSKKNTDVKLENDSESTNNNNNNSNRVDVDPMYDDDEGDEGDEDVVDDDIDCNDAVLDFFDSDFEDNKQVEDKDKENKSIKRSPRLRKRRKPCHESTAEENFDAESFFQNESGDYPCDVCTKVFKTESSVRKHMKLHADESVPEELRTCPHCSRLFLSRAQCKAHVKQICREMRDVPCDACQMTFDTGKEFGEHVRQIHGKGFKCDYCSYVAGQHRYKVLHEKKLHLNMNCKICYKMFDSVDERENHECVKPERFQCSQCEKNYKVKGELKKHIDIIHRGIKFPCNQCSDVLSSSQSLKRHIRTVHETLVKNFRCEVCSKAFKDSDYLQRHMKTHEETTKSFVCQECGKFFKYKVTLKSHIRIMHEKIFKQTCEECGKCFPDMHKLKVHSEMVHMKGELFMCQICGKEMIGKNRLRNHMMTHPKGQKFVACEQCGKEVAETQLRSHIVQAHKMHNYKYPCDYCPKRLDTKAHIRAHIRKHTGARPYLCRGCGKYYPLLETAQKHTRIFHGGDYSLIFYDISKDINNPYVTGS